MIRTQICLGAEEVRWLKKQAHLKGMSMAGIIRDLIRHAHQRINPSKHGKKVSSKKYMAAQTRFPFVGCLKGGRTTDVRRIDDYLYADDNYS